MLPRLAEQEEQVPALGAEVLMETVLPMLLPALYLAEAEVAEVKLQALQKQELMDK